MGRYISRKPEKKTCRKRKKQYVVNVNETAAATKRCGVNATATKRFGLSWSACTLNPQLVAERGEVRAI